MKVPAWQVQTGSYSFDGYCYILIDELDGMGWPKTKLVNRLTPVDKEEQERLQKIRPAFIAEMEDTEEYLSVTDENGTVWTTTEESLNDSVNKGLGLVVAHAIEDGIATVSNFSLTAWRQGRVVYGCDFSLEQRRFRGAGTA